MTSPGSAGRLLMILHAYFPDEPRVAAEARAAIDAGWEVEILALRRPGDPATSVIDGILLHRLPVEHRRGVGAVRMTLEYGGFTLRALRAAARLSRARPYDVVQVHNPPDFLVLAGLLPKRDGARLLFDVHDLGPDMFMMRFENRPGGPVDRLLRLVERWAAGRADAVVTVHDPYRDELVERGVPREKVTVVMNSLDERLAPPPLDGPVADGPFRVVYHGTVTPHYGVSLLVEAAARVRESVPSLQVDVYGEGDDLPELRRRAHELRLEDAVRFAPGFLPQPEVLRAVQGASTGVVPNLPVALNRYALSTKLLEYVTLGIPVVSADLPTIRYHFSDDEVLFFRAGSAADLARALAQTAADPDAAQRRAAAARRRYEGYRWQRNAAVYTGLLAELARRTPSENAPPR